MEKLTIEEFRHLTRKEQNKRIFELSDRDRFIARMEDWGVPDPTGNEPENWEPTEDDLQEIKKIIERDSSQ